jgi:hypothetical protein
VSNVAFVSAANAPLDANSANFDIAGDHHVYLPVVVRND